MLSRIFTFLQGGIFHAFKEFGNMLEDKTIKKTFNFQDHISL